MAKQLLSNFGIKGDTSYTTTGISQGLDQISVDIEDTAHLSKYFKVVEFEPVFTAGKNCISFNGSDFLKDGTEIKVEVLDSDGNSLYLAGLPKNTNYVDIANFTVAIYVFKETIDGAGKVILVGTTTKGEIVRWTANITINTTYQNVSRVRFYNAPYMEVLPLLYPVIQSTTGSMLTTEIVESGSFWINIENDDGAFFPGNSNFGAVLPSNSKIVLWSFQGTPINRVDSFNSQMEGQSITLHYDYADVKIQNTPPIYQYKHVDVTATINKVRSTDTIEISTVPLGPIAKLSDTGGQFTSSYTQTTYLLQSATVPCKASWIHNTLPGYMEVKINTDSFAVSEVGENLIIKYSSLTVLEPHAHTFNPAKKSSTNKVPVTSSLFTIQDISGSRVINVNPFTYDLYSGTHVTSYPVSKVTGSITILSASNPYQQYATPSGTSSLIEKSYVDIVYRNLDTFSGYVARHKLYAQSNIYPGGFQLIADTILGPSELLIDPITPNKNFPFLGIFSSQDQINQYWFVSSASLELVYSDNPLNSMTISPTPDYSAADGNSYVIVKNGAFNVPNDENYYPYDSEAFSQFSGPGYTSNFLFLEKNVQFILSTNIIINKNQEDTATIMFFLTSSVPSIQTEKNYVPSYGLKLGEIVVSDNVQSKVFSDAQEIFFTPANDYYGTLVIVPINCEVVLSNLSLKNYGDYGFSPGACVVQIPFPVNIANEKWTLKSELFDSNYNLIYTLNPVIQTFDPAGVSLFGSNTLSSVVNIPSTVPTLTVTGQFYLPNIGQCNTPKRFVGYNMPQHHPVLSGEGSVCYTNISDLSLVPTNTNITTKDYMSVTTEEGDGQHTGRSIAVRYSGSIPNVFGRRVYIDPSGIKTTYL